MYFDNYNHNLYYPSGFASGLRSGAYSHKGRGVNAAAMDMSVRFLADDPDTRYSLGLGPALRTSDNFVYYYALPNNW